MHILIIFIMRVVEEKHGAKRISPHSPRSVNHALQVVIYNFYNEPDTIIREEPEI
jgi:hypothetical protein